MENLNEEQPVKKSKKGLLAILAIIIIAVIVGGFVYLNSQTKAETIFLKNINKVVDELAQEESHDTVNMELAISGSVDSQDAEIAQMAKYLEGSKVTLNSQTDFKAKTQYVDLDVDYANEDLIKGQAYLNTDEGNIYLYVDELFNKYFKVNMSEIDQSGELKEMLDELFEQNNTAEANKKVASIIKKEIKEKLIADYFSEDDVTVSVAGKDEKVKKSTLTITYNQLRNILVAISNDLQNNEEFLNCYKDPQSIKDTLVEFNQKLNEEDIDDLTIEFSVYTKGLLADTVKFEVIFKQEENEIVFNIEKENDEAYNFNVTVEEETLAGVLNINKVNDNKTNYVINMDVPEVGKVNLNMEVTLEYDKEITPIDVSNNVSINELTDNDQMQIYTNLQSMKIYSLISEAVWALAE